ncbi:MAG: hypothetical protein WAO91_08490 [Candidatus Nitrosotenuis sp.]
MVWIRWDDYGKAKPRKKKKKNTRPKIEPPVKIIPGKHKAEFKKASELD